MTLKDDPKAYAIMGCAMRVHRELGFGFLESAYADALEIEFDRAGIPYEREDEVRIYYGGRPLATTYRADFTCFHREYIVELKAIRLLQVFSGDASRLNLTPMVGALATAPLLRASQPLPRDFHTGMFKTASAMPRDTIQYAHKSKTLSTLAVESE